MKLFKLVISCIIFSLLVACQQIDGKLTSNNPVDASLETESQAIYPRIEAMHSVRASDENENELNSVEWIPPDEPAFFRESSLIVMGKVTSSRDIDFKLSEMYSDPMGFKEIQITGIIRNDTSEWKVNDKITFIHFFNDSYTPTDLRIAEVGHEYMFFLRPSQELHEDYAILRNEAQYLYINGYYLLFEHIENYFITPGVFSNYSTNPQKLSDKLAIRMVNDIPEYGSVREGDTAARIIQEKFTLTDNSRSWIISAKPVVQEADEFVKSIQSNVRRYPYEKNK